ncbi:MAG: tRNA pseudouridine(38-40) synthase TruA [Bacteroidetes bacterium]|nr:tRNA pseudouridine(38-40) synthase TruA [Bacteroidota bacterium]
MARFAIRLDYDGTEYFGWQVQPGQRTVQDLIQKNLSKILQEEISITGCGRTDTGVHAKNFIAHFDTGSVGVNLKFKLNKMLPADISISNLYEVGADFNARFDARSRTYVYRIAHGKSALDQRFVLWDSRKYNVDLMNESCNLVLNTREFGAFCKHHSQNKTTICRVTSAYWVQTENGMEFRVTADRFLRNMVRAMVGTMLEIGLERMRLDEFETVLKNGQRSEAGRSVPAQGLRLDKVDYDESDWVEILD